MEKVLQYSYDRIWNTPSVFSEWLAVQLWLVAKDTIVNSSYLQVQHTRFNIRGRVFGEMGNLRAREILDL